MCCCAEGQIQTRACGVLDQADANRGTVNQCYTEKTAPRVHASGAWTSSAAPDEQICGPRWKSQNTLHTCALGKYEKRYPNTDRRQQYTVTGPGIITNHRVYNKRWKHRKHGTHVCLRLKQAYARTRYVQDGAMWQQTRKKHTKQECNHAKDRSE